MNDKRLVQIGYMINVINTTGSKTTDPVVLILEQSFSINAGLVSVPLLYSGAVATVGPQEILFLKIFTIVYQV